MAFDWQNCGRMNKRRFGACPIRQRVCLRFHLPDPQRAPPAVVTNCGHHGWASIARGDSTRKKGRPKPSFWVLHTVCNGMSAYSE
jgi:hypothetical protein